MKKQKPTAQAEPVPVPKPLDIKAISFADCDLHPEWLEGLKELSHNDTHRFFVTE